MQVIDELKEQVLDKESRMQLYNDLREIVIRLYIETRNNFMKEKKNQF
jgi:hypothetical protein